MEKDSNWNWLRRAFRLLKGRPEKIQRRNGVKYAEKSGASLEMDIYLPGEDYKGYPLILFVHGGGFSEGRRDDPRYVQFAENLADKGYPVASITYRLTMKGRSFGCDQPAENKIATFRAAAEDIWDATRFLHDNAPVFGFMAPPPIVLCGSSAGAEAVLHAAYWPEALLPDGFRYAGVIGMAAAIIELEWISDKNALPTLLFHGIDDPLVPFGSDSHHFCPTHAPGYLLLHGSESIAGRLKGLGKPYLLYKGLEGGHGWADKPMFDHLDVIINFLEDWVRRPGNGQTETALGWH